MQVDKAERLAIDRRNEAIRKYRAAGVQYAKLATLFGLSERHVSRIVNQEASGHRHGRYPVHDPYGSFGRGIVL